MSRLPMLFLLASLIFHQNLAAQNDEPPPGRHPLQTAGLVAAITGIASMFASLNYSYECPKGLEHSDLGYECYADYDKKLHTELARPTMLYAGIGGLVGGVIIAKIGKDRLEKGTSVTITPNGVIVAYRW